MKPRERAMKSPADHENALLTYAREFNGQKSRFWDLISQKLLELEQWNLKHLLIFKRS
jgi:hypothetical protein